MECGVHSRMAGWIRGVMGGGSNLCCAWGGDCRSNGGERRRGAHLSTVAHGNTNSGHSFEHLYGSESRGYGPSAWLKVQGKKKKQKENRGGGEKRREIANHADGDREFSINNCSRRCQTDRGKGRKGTERKRMNRASPGSCRGCQ